MGAQYSTSHLLMLAFFPDFPESEQGIYNMLTCSLLKDSIQSTISISSKYLISTVPQFTMQSDIHCVICSATHSVYLCFIFHNDHFRRKKIATRCLYSSFPVKVASQGVAIYKGCNTVRGIVFI